MDDLEFIAGDFLEYIDLPREKLYLTRYFATGVQDQFLRYMHLVGHWRHFCDHTGHACTRRNLQLLHRRLKGLEAAYAKAKDEMDFETLEQIEKGLYGVMRFK